MSSRFSDLGLPADVVAALAARGMSEAFPIQSLTIPPALAGKDVCGRAPTGSGKTLAFGLPLALRVGSASPGRPRALVLAPTRELAAQIHRELETLLAPRKRTVVSVYGGVGMTPQIRAVRRGVDVIVACPGRLADLLRGGHLKLSEVEIVVIDEADRMADMGFLPEVKRILDQVRPDRQTLLFSATLDGDVDVLIKRYQRSPERCEFVPDDADLAQVTHEFVRTSREDRVNIAAELVTKHGSTVVFCRTKHGADRVARQLERAGVSAVPIHGGRSQGQRDRALAAFRAGDAQALVATDVAARGIHVDNVNCVVHFDVAGDHKDYVHRSGRTGRAGNDGVVVTLVTDEDVADVRKLQRALDLPATDGPAPRGSSTPRAAAPAGSGAPRGNAGGPGRRSSAPAGAAPGKRRRPFGRGGGSGRQGASSGSSSGGGGGGSARRGGTR